MKTDTILIALAIGFSIFVFRWDAKSAPTQAFKYQSFACLGIYYGMKRHNSKLIEQNPQTEIVFGKSFWIGFRICLVASIFAGLLYLLVPDSSDTIYESGKLLRTLDVAISTIIIGTIITLIGAAVSVWRQF